MNCISEIRNDIHSNINFSCSTLYQRDNIKNQYIKFERDVNKAIELEFIQKDSKDNYKSAANALIYERIIDDNEYINQNSFRKQGKYTDTEIETIFTELEFSRKINNALSQETIYKYISSLLELKYSLSYLNKLKVDYGLSTNSQDDINNYIFKKAFDEVIIKRCSKIEQYSKDFKFSTSEEYDVHSLKQSNSCEGKDIFHTQIYLIKLTIYKLLVCKDNELNVPNIVDIMRKWNGKYSDDVISGNKHYLYLIRIEENDSKKFVCDRFEHFIIGETKSIDDVYSKCEKAYPGFDIKNKYLITLTNTDEEEVNTHLTKLCEICEKRYYKEVQKFDNNDFLRYDITLNRIRRNSDITFDLIEALDNIKKQSE